MSKQESETILIVNAGSSSIKFTLFSRTLDQLLSGKFERTQDKKAELKMQLPSSTQGEIIAQWDDVLTIVKKIEQCISANHFLIPKIVGHRLVHGGRDFVKPTEITKKVLQGLHVLEPLAPEHLPLELALIENFSLIYPEATQIGCFDTSFHRAMPKISKIIPLPRRYFERGLERFGFHGISYSYIMQELVSLNEPLAKKGKVILAHLGNGSSLAALVDGVPIDTSMSFTPAAGCIMGTRCGDLDPGIVRYLMTNDNLTALDFDRIVNHESGLLGISELSSNVKVLLESNDARACEAIEMYCLQIKKFIGAFAARIGGIDLLVFSGGIGENSSVIRDKICSGLEFVGLKLDRNLNDLHSSVASASDSKVKIYIIKTKEEQMIADICRTFDQH